jgi:hypothetical protein
MASASLPNGIESRVTVRHIRRNRLAFAACASVIEQLEKRSLLSAVVGSDGTLTVTGTPQADTIDVSFHIDFTPGNAGEVYVFDDGTDYGFSTKVVKRVSINGGEGNDNISINGSETDDDPKAAALNFVVVDGNGNDTVDSNIADTGFVQANVPAPTVSLTAGNGDDTISAQGCTTATIVAGDGNDYLFAAANTDALTVALTAGNGTDTIQGISAGDASLTINATVGTGHDTFENGNDPDISIDAHTRDGQTSGAQRDEVFISGRAAVGSVGEPGITVDLNKIIDGVVYNNAFSTTTDANGDYNFEIGSTNPDTADYQVHISTSSFNTTTPIRQESAPIGVGFSNDNFQLLPPSAANPVIIGSPGSWHNLGNIAAFALDGNFNTFFDAATATGNYVGLDYGSPQEVKQISYAPRAGFGGRMFEGVFQGANLPDFSDAVMLWTVSNTPPSNRLTTVNIPDPRTFRYVRYLGPANSYCNIAEMQVTLVTPFVGTPIGTAGSYHNLGNTIANAFDRNTTTFFDAPDASGDWVGIDLGSPQVVRAVTFTPRTGYESRMIGGQFQASNSANFTGTVYTFAVITTKPATGATTVLSLYNSTAFRYYRYIGPTNGYCNVAELGFDG